MPFLFLLTWLQSAGNSWREYVLADIQASVGTHRPTIWGVIDPRLFVSHHWLHPDLAQGLSYHRSATRVGEKLVLVETWSFAPEDLADVARLFGHREWLAWENILGEIPDGRVVASKARGQLILLREAEANTPLWQMPAFDLAQLPTVATPLGAANTPLLFSETSSNLALFLNDVFTEELLDRNGLSIRISKHWHITNHFSRLSPYLRLVRSVRLDYNGTFSVFDIYSFGGELLLGSHAEQQDQTLLEIGALLDLDRSVVVIRSGIPTWHQAVFSAPFPPNRFPYSQAALRALPQGMRFVFPATSGLWLVERARKPSSWLGRLLFWRQHLHAGATGSFFVSLSRRTDRSLELRFGGRIERLGELELALRPDFDGTFDPLRLLTGSLVQQRSRMSSGTKLILERNIDLQEESQLKMVLLALRRGIRFNGLALGLGGAINFTFRKRFDTFLVEEFILGKLPEVAWERATLSHFLLRRNYSKLGLRPASLRASTDQLFDRWQIRDLAGAAPPFEGWSARIQRLGNVRLFNQIDRRKTELRAVEGVGGEGGSKRFMEITDIFEDSLLKPREARRIKNRLQRTWQDAYLDDLFSSSEEQTLPETLIGYRLLLTNQALLSLRMQLLAPANQDPRLSQWLGRHPILMARLRKAKPGSTAEFQVFCQLLYKMTRSHGPLHLLCGGLPLEHYHFEWRLHSASRPTLNGERGSAALSRGEIRVWQGWESLGALDDLYIDRSFPSALE
jgi:hypothetical protein